jgi:hypothetical protein
MAEAEIKTAPNIRSQELKSGSRTKKYWILSVLTSDAL